MDYKIFLLALYNKIYKINNYNNYNYNFILLLKLISYFIYYISIIAIANKRDNRLYIKRVVLKKFKN